MSAATITSWLLTYMLHSSVLLSIAWLVSRVLGDRRLALQELVLRAALVGGLLTATVQVGIGVEPVGGALAVEGLTATEPVTVRESTVVADVGAMPPQVFDARARASWPNALLALWIVGSTLALAALSRSILDLRRLLQTRRFRPAGRLLDRLAAAMGLRRRVRFSTSKAIAVPFATGIRHPEICCPERVGDLAQEHRMSLFAHELAHLARRDPTWQLLYRIGEAILFLQPLNRLVRRRLEEIAEHLTDERAVACTGDRLGLARCLVVVSHWGVSSRPGVPAAAFAAGPRLDRRVRHLISGTVGQPFDSRWAISLLAALLAASVILLPAISATTVHADISHDESGDLPAKTWSDANEAQPVMPAPPAVPEPASPSTVAPDPVAVPAPAAAPVLDPATAAPAATAPVAIPIAVAVPAPEVAPVSEALPAPATVPASPAAAERPPMPEQPPPPPARDEEARHQRERARDEARARQRDAWRARAEAHAQARERAELARADYERLREAAREEADRSRARAREAAERARLTDAERDEFRRRAEAHRAEARERSLEQAERSRALAREAAEKARLTGAECEAIRKAAEARRAEARERARDASRLSEEQIQELADRARRLAEEAEAERQH